MQWSDYLRDRLDKLIDTPARTVNISAYRFALDERQIFHTERGYRRLASGRLTLIWQDGSVSSHRIAPPLSAEEPLPIDLWRRNRLFQRHKRHFPKPAGSCPDVAVYDEAIASALRRQSLPVLPAGFGAELALQKKTVAHSKGMWRQADLTEATLFPLDGRFPFPYRSRRLPDCSESAYLETEVQWWDRQPVESVGLLSWDSGSTAVLLAPDAFRQLLQNGLLRHLEQAESRHIALSFLQSVSGKTSLLLRFDPLVPWSPGSYRFSEEGFAAKALSLPQLAGKREAAASAGSLHWKHQRSLRFREWLAGQPSVLYISRFQLPDLFHPQQTLVAWATHAVLFREGRPLASGMTWLTLCLAELLCFCDNQLVSKVGWDVSGIAVSAGRMGMTP